MEGPTGRSERQTSTDCQTLQFWHRSKLQRVDADIAEAGDAADDAEEHLGVAEDTHSFISWIGQRDNIIEQMKLAYRERMKAEIDVEADPSVFDSLFEEAPEVVPDLIEKEANRPGYEGYRRRLNAFDGRAESNVGTARSENAGSASCQIELGRPLFIQATTLATNP